MFRTEKSYDPKQTFDLAQKQRAYNSPYEGLQAMYELGSSFDIIQEPWHMDVMYSGPLTPTMEADKQKFLDRRKSTPNLEDPEFSTTGAIKDMYAKAQLTADEDWMTEEERAAIPKLTAAEANAKYRPPKPYTHDVRVDVAEFENKSRNQNLKQKAILGNIGPERFGSMALPMVGAVFGGLSDPVALGLDVATGGVGIVAAAGRFGVRAAKVAKIVGYGKRVGKIGIAQTFVKNFIENATPEAIIELRNYKVGKEFHMDQFVTNLTAGAVAGTFIELGVDFARGHRFFDTDVDAGADVPPNQIGYDGGPDGPTADGPTADAPPSLPKWYKEFDYKNVDEMIRTNTMMNENLVQSGFKPVEQLVLDYSHQSVNQLKEYISDTHNKLGRSKAFQTRMNNEYARVLPQFTPDGIRNLGDAARIDFNSPYYKNSADRMNSINRTLDIAEKAETARVSEAKTLEPTDEGFELRIKDLKYRKKIAEFYDNMGGDLEEMRLLQEAIFAQGNDLPPLMKKYLNEVEDSIRMFDGRSYEKVIRRPVDKVSIYREAYDGVANHQLDRWGFDSNYKSIADEAAEQGARVTTEVDLDKLPGDLDRELSPTEIIERIQRATEHNFDLAEEVNTMKDAHKTRMKNLQMAHKELVDAIKKEKHIDDIVEIMERAELESDPAIRAELKETLAEYEAAMREAMEPDEFRDVMDSLFDCIRR